MSGSVTFGNILTGTGKRGILKPLPDNSGYWRVNAGGFNIPNRHGTKYTFNQYLRECMHPDSDFSRRVRDRQVFCELGHPEPFFVERINGQIVRTRITEVFQWVNRLRKIEMANVCAHVREVIWTPSNINGGAVLIDAELTPFGPYKEWTADALTNPDINFALSMRTVTAPQEMGDTVREVEWLSTLDVVVEQGVERSCKYHTAGLEDYLQERMASGMVEMTSTIDEVIFVCERELQNPSIMTKHEGMESLKPIYELVAHLKSLKSNRKVHLVRASSIDAFR